MFETFTEFVAAQRAVARKAGWPVFLSYLAQRPRASRFAGRRPFRLRTPYARYPLWCRPGTTDVNVFRQIYVLLEYSCLDDADPGAVKLVVDCGAYAGYSAAYFLTRFPGCRVVAVEPDPDNHALAARNLAPYGDRVTLVRAGVWSAAVALAPDEAPFGDGREWARRLRRADPAAAGLPGVTVASLLDGSGFDRISVLKIDIEGGEAEVFSGDCSWVDRVDALVIELHGPECEAAFRRAVDGRGFAVSRCCELTVCRRPPPA